MKEEEQRKKRNIVPIRAGMLLQLLLFFALCIELSIISAFFCFFFSFFHLSNVEDR